MKESAIEKKVCDYAKRKGWKVYKFTSPGNRAVPDRIFIKQGIVFMIEFKQEGKKPTKLQKKVIKEISDENIYVFVCDNVVDGKQIIDNFKISNEKNKI